MKYFFSIALVFGLWIQAGLADDTVSSLYEKEAKRCEDIPCIRKEIDQINVQIMKLLAQRTAYVQRAGDLKLHTGVANDSKRVQSQLDTLAALSDELGLPREISLETFRAIMTNSIEFEQRYIDQRNRK